MDHGGLEANWRFVLGDFVPVIVAAGKCLEDYRPYNAISLLRYPLWIAILCAGPCQDYVLSHVQTPVPGAHPRRARFHQ